MQNQDTFVDSFDSVPDVTEADIVSDAPSAAPMSQAPQAGQSDQASQTENLRFRDAMAELNDIVALLESNTLELEESLVKYERAIYLLRFLRTRLTQAQQKVDVLMGQLDESPADSTVDSTLSKA